jgi:alkylhydroperoxidase/carboxymuconolactone decarboxylase family protein YurZ
MGKNLRKNDVNAYVNKFILKSNDSEIKFLCFIAACISAKKLYSLEHILIIAKSINIGPKKIYETIIQIYLFCGFPATIEALKVFNKLFPSFEKKYTEFDLNLYIKKGQKNCRNIYRENYSKLLDNFTNLSPDLKDWMIIEGYGKVMGRTGLILKERELINVTVLSTNYYEHQLYSHLKGAINTNSSIELIEAIINLTSLFNKRRNVRKSMMLLNAIKKQLK